MAILKLCADCGGAYAPAGPRVHRCPDCQAGWRRRDDARRNAKPSKRFYESAEWRRVSRAIRERDGACVRCGSTDRLIAHHVRPRADIEAEGGDVYDEANLETVCARCSGELDGGRGTPARVARERRG